MRGVAVLGILAINVAGFVGPPAAAYSPTIGPLAPAIDNAAFALSLLVFEGKMRGLFALLFGASLELFVTHADAAGQSGGGLQVRRLLWLAVFGYLHFALLWWGDILFTYAFAGFSALALRRLPGRALVGIALVLFAAWQIDGARGAVAPVIAETRIAGTTPGDRHALAALVEQARQNAEYYSAATRAGFAAQVDAKLAHQPLAPLDAAIFEYGEVLPFMLLGIALLRAGFFTGAWPGAVLTKVALGGLAAGGGVTLTFVGWAWKHAFPPAAMRLAIDHALGFPHLAMTLGYAALLVRFAPAILASALGRRIAAAGRMAFSNYIGCTVLMTATFYGWGLGLGGHVGSAMQAGFVLFGWALMLLWSAPWLARFRQGPLEWLWRSLVAGRMMPLRRQRLLLRSSRIIPTRTKG